MPVRSVRVVVAAAGACGEIGGDVAFVVVTDADIVFFLGRPFVLCEFVSYCVGLIWKWKATKMKFDSPARNK